MYGATNVDMTVVENGAIVPARRLQMAGPGRQEVSRGERLLNGPTAYGTSMIWPPCIALTSA